jgi:HSP20 family protein
MDEFFNTNWLDSWDSGLKSFHPSVEIEEKDKSFELTAELPGMTKKDIEVEVKEGVLTIRGERKSEKEENKKGVRYSERTFGSFSRSFNLPEGVASDQIKAEFKDGLLTLEIPKAPEKIKEVKKIEVH